MDVDLSGIIDQCREETLNSALRLILNSGTATSYIKQSYHKRFLYELIQNCNDHNIKLDFIRPGKPTENARVERFNGSFRRELLNCYVFGSLSEVREKVLEWMEDYNYHRPHEALDNLSPIQFLNRHNSQMKLLA